MNQSREPRKRSQSPEGDASPGEIAERELQPSRPDLRAPVPRVGEDEDAPIRDQDRAKLPDSRERRE